MPVSETVKFIDNTVVAARPDHYMEIMVDAEKVLLSLQKSLFSYDWILPDGRIKSCEELPESDQKKRQDIEKKLEQDEPLEKPVLGIGIIENVEIGSGKATFLTLAAIGQKTIPVHIPKSNEQEFAPFLS